MQKMILKISVLASILPLSITWRMGKCTLGGGIKEMCFIYTWCLSAA